MEKADSNKTADSLRQDVLKYAADRYGTKPDFPWNSLSEYAVLRHDDTKKWYALIMSVPRERLGLSGKDCVDILNIKCDPVLNGSLRMEKGFLPAYHMHRETWITILLDGTVEKDAIFPLLEMSYELTSGRRGGKGSTRSKSWDQEQRRLAEELLEKAKEFGADLAGLTSAARLKNSPSEQLFPQMKDHARDHFAEQITTGLPHGAVKWEPEEKTVLVFAVSHPEDEPELDWWCGEVNPPGNKLLAEISGKLKRYIEERYPDIHVYPKPYHVEKGGIYLKDAAVEAGLGCIGRNNLLITPEYGPRVRLRAIALSKELPPSKLSDFDPCLECGRPCAAACPKDAFSKVVYTREEGVPSCLPAREGDYYRKQCALEMEENERTAPMEQVLEYSKEPMPVIRYCRACEFSCRYRGSRES